MPVVQVPLYVEPEIYKDLLSGKLIRHGGVIRDTAGHIIKHLADAPMKNEAAEQAVQVAQKAGKFDKVIDVLKANKKTVIIGTVVAATVAIGTGIYVHAQNKKVKKMIQVPDEIVQFEKSLQEYLEAARKGAMDVHHIDTLLEATNKLENKDDASKYRLDLSIGDLKTLIQTIFTYTERLAKANNYDISEFNAANAHTENNIILLTNHLRMQKKIYEEAA